MAARNISIMMFAVLTASYSASCTGSIKLRDVSSVHHDTDWSQAGGGTGRNYVARDEIAPPLYRVWRKSLSSAPGMYMTALQGNLFIGTMGGKLFVLRAEDGSKRGSLDLGGSLVGGAALDGINAYIGKVDDKNSIYGYEVRNGDFLWKKSVGGIASAPLIAGGLLYAASLNGSVYCMDMETGNVKWKFNSGKPFRTSPAKWKELVIAAGDSGYVYGINGVDGTEEWRFDIGEPIFASPVIYDNKVLAGSISGRFVCLDAASGSLEWEFRTGGGIFSSSAAYGGTVYVGSNDDKLYALSMQTGEEEWSVKTKGPVNSGVLVSGGYLYFGSLDHFLYCVDTSTGEILWKEELDGRVRSTPIEHHGMLFVGAENKYIYGFLPVEPVEKAK